MNHDEAIRSNGVARYLLGEMDGAELEQFEAHFFECRLCAREITVGSELLECLRADLTSPVSSVSPSQKLRRCRVLIRIHLTV